MGFRIFPPNKGDLNVTDEHRFFKKFIHVKSSEKGVLLMSSELACCQLGLDNYFENFKSAEIRVFFCENLWEKLGIFKKKGRQI